MKKFLKRIFCNHENVELVRWCIKHISAHEPSCAVIEYRCNKCGKYVYVYQYGQDKADWIRAMGEYKHENFCGTR